MSQGALFAWGTVIFFTVTTGAFLYGLATVRQYFEETKKLDSWGSE